MATKDSSKSKASSSTQTLPSANWLALRKKIPHKSKLTAARRSSKSSATDRRSTTPAPRNASPESQSFPRGSSVEAPLPVSVDMSTDEIKNGESLLNLRKMVLGQIEHSPAHTQPGKYVAIDCEMVGVGIDGEESALARVSLVNFHGAVLLDAFVRPRERVVDYRTQWSGIRPTDMVHAKSFEEVQKQVADILKDRILVGHAVHNDLKALLLSHPRPLLRDTQSLSHKHKLPSARGRRPALRHLVQHELGLTIQSGEHSSVTDARATMALFRLHRKEWEKDFRPLALTLSRARSRSRSRSKSPTRAAAESSSKSSVPAKRARRSSSPATHESDEDGDDDDALSQPPAKKPKSKTKLKSSPSTESDAKVTFPGGGRRGVSSGLSTVIRRMGTVGEKAKSKAKSKSKDKWWKELGGGSSSSSGAKGSMRLKVRR
ncbi:ribonuclease H-like domain-containing protein [Cubamyces lactineus]|nr:ribonuclease H-like domain-containing protein [Cubamyces lactineus]